MIQLTGSIEADLKTVVYDAISDLLQNTPLSQLISDSAMLSRLSGQSIRVFKSSVLEPADMPALSIAGLPEEPMEAFVGQHVEEEGTDEDGEWPAYWGQRFRAQVSIEAVALNSQLRDDMYRLCKVLAMAVAYRIIRDEDGVFSNPTVMPGGEGAAEFAQDPTIIFHAGVRISAQYLLALKDVADTVGTVHVGTMTPIT